MLGENIGDGHAGRGFDFCVCVGKIKSKTQRQAPPHGRFARAHHTHEHKRAPAKAAHNGCGALVGRQWRLREGAGSVGWIVKSLHGRCVSRRAGRFKRRRAPRAFINLPITSPCQSALTI
jgi:hypothetical protein